MLSVCPVTCSEEPVDRFTCYKNITYVKVTSTRHFKFYFPSISENNMADTKAEWK